MITAACFRSSGIASSYKIEIRVVGARLVVQRILNELEAWQPECVERHVIGAAGVQRRQCRRPEVVERLQPRFEDRTHGFVALKIHAADPARAVVQVEIRGELRVLGLERHRFRIAEVALHIAERSEIVLLLARPQRDPDLCAAV